MSDPVTVGLVGCGNISGTYLEVVKGFQNLEVIACADIDMERARVVASKFHLPQVLNVDELIGHPEIQVVLNLTPPGVHAEISAAVLNNTKSVYSEKPLAIDVDEGRELIKSAHEMGLFFGCAPDTFLGAGYQTCRKLIDEGAIGDVVGATALMLSSGHERWHPAPAFFYQKGGGPLFDMGPYYLTALIHLLGPISRVSGSARASFPERVIGSGPNKGEKIQVDTPTHVAALLEFNCGVLGTLVTSFDVWDGNVPRIEIYGSDGTLSAPDPNQFGGPVRLWRAKSRSWEAVELVPGRSVESRSLGLADMASGMPSGRQPRASGSLAFHVLETMNAILVAAEEGRHIVINSSCSRPDPLGW